MIQLTADEERQIGESVAVLIDILQRDTRIRPAVLVRNVESTRRLIRVFAITMYEMGLRVEERSKPLLED